MIHKDDNLFGALGGEVVGGRLGGDGSQSLCHALRLRGLLSLGSVVTVSVGWGGELGNTIGSTTNSTTATSPVRGMSQSHANPLPCGSF